MSVVTPARACGIDFGTSNSTAGWLRPGQPSLLALEDGKVTLPAVKISAGDLVTVDWRCELISLIRLVRVASISMLSFIDPALIIRESVRIELVEM